MKYIFTLLSVVVLFASCSPHTTPAKHRRYHDWKKQGPDFPDIGNLGPAKNYT